MLQKLARMGTTTVFTPVKAQRGATPEQLQARMAKYREQLSIDLEIIMPQRAEHDLLALNSINRSMRETLYKKYAARMAMDKWKVDGQTIVYDINGLIVNGQNRFKACVLSQTPFLALVVRGVDPDARETTDDHGARSATDTIGLLNIPHSRAVANASQTVIRYFAGSSRWTPKVSNDEVSDFIRDYPNFPVWVANANPSQRDMHRAIPLVAAVTWIGSYTYPVEAHSFMQGFITAAGHSSRSPILALRQRFSLADNRLRSAERVQLTIMAWNAFIEKRAMSKIQLPKKNTEAFPKVKGAKR